MTKDDYSDEELEQLIQDGQRFHKLILKSINSPAGRCILTAPIGVEGQEIADRLRAAVDEY